jgi:DNA-binding XRE family transcriptional regulator
MKLSNRLREHRGRLRITQKALAERIGCSRMAINKMEAGSIPNLVNALKIAKVFKVSLHEIFKLQ